MEPDRSTDGAQMEPGRSTDGAQMEPGRSTDGAQTEPDRSTNGAQLEDSVLHLSSTDIDIELEIEGDIEKESGRGGVGETHTTRKRVRVSKVDQNLEVLQKLSDLYGFSDPVYAKLTEWMRYKGEIGDTYKETGMKAFLTKAKNAVSTYGEDAAIAAIDTAMSRTWKGVYWEKGASSGVRQGIDWDRV